jgi:hypothetical protein
MFVAGVVMLIISVTLSVFNVAMVLSASPGTPVAVPTTIGFEGFLADSNGQPLTTGTYSITFSIYNVATGGTALWSETKQVQVTSGLYATTLGTTNNPVFLNSLNDVRWIGVAVSGGAEVTPRTQILSVPFAINADSANKVQGVALNGMIAAFASASGCPEGWTEYTNARGRTIVGAPSGGTIGGTVGNLPLSNLENRAHAHTGPGVASGSGVIGGTGPAYTGDLMPYIQLTYCKFGQP